MLPITETYSLLYSFTKFPFTVGKTKEGIWSVSDNRYSIVVQSNHSLLDALLELDYQIREYEINDFYWNLDFEPDYWNDFKGKSYLSNGLGFELPFYQNELWVMEFEKKQYSSNELSDLLIQIDNLKEKKSKKKSI